MSDACCGHDEPAADRSAEPEPGRVWQVSELRFAAASGVFLLGRLIAGGLDASHTVEVVLEAVALALGAWTFVPGTL